MKITLNIGGENKIFTVDFVSARMVRKTIEVTEKIDLDKLSVKELDSIVGFIVELFKKQFTIDELYDGLASKDLISTIQRCINEVVEGVKDVTTDEKKN